MVIRPSRDGEVWARETPYGTLENMQSVLSGSNVGVQHTQNREDGGDAVVMRLCIQPAHGYGALVLDSSCIPSPAPQVLPPLCAAPEMGCW